MPWRLPKTDTRAGRRTVLMPAGVAGRWLGSGTPSMTPPQTPECAIHGTRLQSLEGSLSLTPVGTPQGAVYRRGSRHLHALPAIGEDVECCPTAVQLIEAAEEPPPSHLQPLAYASDERGGIFTGHPGGGSTPGVNLRPTPPTLQPAALCTAPRGERGRHEARMSSHATPAHRDEDVGQTSGDDIARHGTPCTTTPPPPETSARAGCDSVALSVGSLNHSSVSLEDANGLVAGSLALVRHHRHAALSEVTGTDGTAPTLGAQRCIDYDAAM